MAVFYFEPRLCHAAGRLCRVTIAGGVTRQFSGLKPGRYYMASPEGVVLAPRIDTLGGTSEKDALGMITLGKAISSTELVIKYSN